MRYLILIVLSLAILFPFCKNENNFNYSAPKDYRTWKKATDKILDYSVPGHGASFRVIYANDIALKAQKIKGKDGNDQLIYPDGSVIIKEVYKNKNGVNRVSPKLYIMYKDTSGKDSLEGWHYLVQNPDGKPAQAITSRMCIGCHEAANDKHLYFDKNPDRIFRDYLFINVLKK